MKILIVALLLLFCTNSFGQYLSGDSDSIQENSNSQGIDSTTNILNCPPGSEYAIGYRLRAKPLDPMGEVEKFCPEGTVERYNPKTMYPECMAIPNRTSNVKDNFRHNRAPPTHSLCQQKLRSTEQACKGSQLLEAGSVANMLAQQVARARASGNMKQACATAKQISGFSYSTNAAMAHMCLSAIKSCRSACISESDGDAVTECESFEKHAKMAAAQAVQSAQSFAKSSECVEVVSGSCVGQAAYDNDNCPEFCQKPGRQNHAKCRIAANHCTDSNYAAQNIRLCACIANPLSPVCSGQSALTNTVTNTPAPPVGNPTAPDFQDLPREYEMQANDHAPTPASVNSNNDYVDGSVPSSAESFAFGVDDSSGFAQPTYDTDILHGRGSTPPPALGTPESIYGYDPADYEPQPTDTSEGFSLKDFLPDFLVGSSKNKTRIPASAGYPDQTITKSDGLTNWQKVSRRIQILRPELAP